MSSNWRDRLSAVGEEHYAHGVADDARIALSSIRLNGGSEFAPQKSGVTVLVGANNAGKSTLLREVAQRFSLHPGQDPEFGIALDSVAVENHGTQADVIAWVAERAEYQEYPGVRGFIGPNLGQVAPSFIGSGWGTGSASLGGVAALLVFHGDAQGRFNMGGSAEMRSSILEPAVSPIHHLQDSKEMMEALRGISRRIFGKSLTLDNLGRTVRLRVGELSIPAPPVDSITADYIAAMNFLPELDLQGDGMRSVLGQLLPLVTASHQIVLLDEPEAFLHPPQAHALGRELGRISSSGAQLVIATHDRNLLAGLLESDVDITVVRLSRDGGPAASHQLNAGDLRTLWSDPVLKYSNVLDGLFHRLVVVGEADGDCAYLAAALDHPSREDALPSSEVLFVPTGGKAGMAKVCQALRALDVPVVAAPDLDVLSDVGLLRSLVQALGFTWDDELQEEWERATADLRAPRSPVKVQHVKDAVSAVLEGKESEVYTSDLKEAVMAATRSGESPWAAVKAQGIGAFRGDAYGSILRLLTMLERVGIVPVREGELERLAPGVAVRKGPAWLAAALAQGEQANRPTQEHIDRILASGSFVSA